MVSELTDLLREVPGSGERDDYAMAIIDDNVLGKQTTATRRLTNQRLGELYGLSLTIPLFRVLRRLWDADEAGRPLIALFCALARDPLLRATSVAVLPLPIGAELLRSSMSSAIRTSTGDRLNDSTLDKVARNAASSWAQSGHLKGRVRKIRQEVRPTPGAVAFAIWLGSLQGISGEGLLQTSWSQVLDQSPTDLLDLALRAKQLGLLNARVGGGIVEPPRSTPTASPIPSPTTLRNGSSTVTPPACSKRATPVTRTPLLSFKSRSADCSATSGLQNSTRRCASPKKPASGSFATMY